jgi:hypothetical protein
VVTMDILPEQLRHFDGRIGDYAIEKGRYELLIGAASNDIRGEISLEIK